MSGSNGENAGLQAITDRNIEELTGSPRAVLVIGKTDCGHCVSYEREILELQSEGALAGVAIGKLLLDAPGAPRFKRDNPWVGTLKALPHTLIFIDGEHVENFAASRGSYLVEQLEALATASAG